MNYELAKQLKEAGFRQDTLFVYAPNGEKTFNSKWVPKPIVAAPMLDELIGACGDKFGSLSPWHVIKVKGKKKGSISKWTATRFEASCGVAECCPGEAGDGSTPEEAVANLWLALNKKK